MDAALRRHRPYTGRNPALWDVTTSDYTRCAAKRGADGGGSTTCEARRPYHCENEDDSPVPLKQMAHFVAFNL